MKQKLYVTVRESAGFLFMMEIESALYEKFEDFNVVIENDISDYSIKNVISVNMDNLGTAETADILKRLAEFSKAFNVVIITGEQKTGVTAVGFDKDILTDDLKEFFNNSHGIVKTIELTCRWCPEQYDCFDEYGNQVAYLRLRHGVFTVECPDCGIGTSTCVYENWEDITGDGDFGSDEERISQLECAFNAIDYYYSHTVKTIRRIASESEDEDYKYEKIDSEYTDQEMMETLYAYQKSNFMPDEVLSIRHKGHAIGYKEAVKKVLREHRLIRHNMFPEENGADGLNEEHIEHELEFFKTTIDGLGGQIKTINWLFNKNFKDFETIFREYATKGTNSL